MSRALTHRHSHRLGLLALTVASLSLAPPAEAERPPLFAASKTACANLPAHPKVVAIGSSTMRGTLGPMLQHMVKKRHLSLTIKNAAKSSTGLARPDFYDWHAEARKIAAKEHPDMWLVSLGTNDYQAVHVGKHKWLRPPTEAWAKAYGARVRGLLEILSGKDHTIPVVYIGSTAFNRPASRRIGPKLNDIIMREIQAFVGPAIFYDVFQRTTNAKNRPLKRARTEGRRGSFKVYGPDGVHLTRKATRWLMAEPALQQLLKCAGQAAP